MSRRNSKWQDYGIEEVDPKIKFNSLLSATVSTIMCLAAKCPLPRVNVETTKLFLSKITDDNGNTPRNIKGFLSLLNNYTGPYDGESCMSRFENAPPPQKHTSKKPSSENVSVSSKTPSQFHVKETISIEAPPSTRRTTRPVARKTDKEGGERMRKPSRTPGPRVSTSRSVISNKS